MRFRGYPARCYGPTVPLDWPSDPDPVRFHIRHFAKGRVSSAIGKKIGVGHRVRLTGPFGSAYLRHDQPGRLVLVASGTGFAPIWSIAEAAIRERPQRELVLIAGARSIESLYMIPALCRIALFPGVTIVPVVSQGETLTAAVLEGRPTDYLPALCPDDVVYAAGAPAMVEAVSHIAARGGARCYSDPFERVRKLAIRPDCCRAPPTGSVSSDRRHWQWRSRRRACVRSDYPIASVEVCARLRTRGGSRARQAAVNSAAWRGAR